MKIGTAIYSTSVNRTWIFDPFNAARKERKFHAACLKRLLTMICTYYIEVFYLAYKLNWLGPVYMEASQPGQPGP